MKARKHMRRHGSRRQTMRRVISRACDVVFWVCLLALVGVGVSSAWTQYNMRQAVCGIAAFCAVGVVAAAGRAGKLEGGLSDDEE